MENKQLCYCNSGEKIANIVETLLGVLKEHPHATIHCSKEGYIVICEE